ncbi:MAG: hypothetical protein JNK48_07250 [Bryobacterales bacterium]|nr:hypothetical protein [Bryobacterales bacterium]
MTRYLPSKQYQYAGVGALVLAMFCAAFAFHFPLSWVPTGLLLATGIAMLALGCLPAIEIQEACLSIGDKIIPWEDIKKVDRTGFVSPLLVYLTLRSGKRILLVYPGGMEASNMLLRQLSRMTRDAIIDGIPYRQYWGESAQPAADRRAMSSPKYQLLRPEDEADVERLFQKLKSVGHLDRTEE